LIHRFRFKCQHCGLSVFGSFDSQE
jgi:hypothetical protein